MKRLNILILLTSAFIFITSCNNDDETSNIPALPSVDVYVAGQKEGNACYWKNNVLTILDNNGASFTSAQKIIVQNDNIYILGTSVSGNIITYLYWKNGVLSNLNTLLDETNYDLNSITDMEVINGDVYLVGYLQNTTNPTEEDLVYWKNGVKTVVLQNCIFQYGYSNIKIVGNNTYVLSNNENNQSGVFINSSFNLINTYLKYSMALNGSAVYIYGSTNPGGFYTNVDTGTEVVIPYSLADLVFDSGDIYTVGNYNNSSLRRMIQKNGLPYYISPEGFETHIVDLEVKVGNVYTIVRELTSANYGLNKLLINNNTEFVLDDPDGFQGNLLNSIYVVQN